MSQLSHPLYMVENMAYDDFRAGWAARGALEHEGGWGPAPPETPEKAWRKYKGIPEPPPVFECPACGTSPMVKRKNRLDGTIFLGCPKFPNCRGTRDEYGGQPRTGKHRFDWTYDDYEGPDWDDDDGYYGEEPF